MCHRVRRRPTAARSARRQCVDAQAVQKLPFAHTLGYGCAPMRCRILAAAACGLLLAAGCRPEQESPSSGKPAADAAKPADPNAGQVIATYGKHQLTRGDVMDELERLPAPSRAYLNAPDRKKQFVENMVINELLYDEGKQAGTDRDPEIERQRDGPRQ